MRDRALWLSARLSSLKADGLRQAPLVFDDVHVLAVRREGRLVGVGVGGRPDLRVSSASWRACRPTRSTTSGSTRATASSVGHQGRVVPAVVHQLTVQVFRSSEDCLVGDRHAHQILGILLLLLIKIWHSTRLPLLPNPVSEVCVPPVHAAAPHRLPIAFHGGDACHSSRRLLRRARRDLLRRRGARRAQRARGRQHGR